MQEFENAVLAAFPLSQWRNRRVCLAVSGGADSVALLRATTRIAENAALKKNLFVITIDHRSRGAESDGDVRFVCELAETLGLEYYVYALDPNELREEVKRQGSWESAARVLRYRLLVDGAKRCGARYLATAHHRDDQLETLLFRLFRGTGLDGLRGVAPYRALDEALTIVRPLLDSSRADILAYLRSLGQTYRTDSSNASPKYARNRIRNELIPALESIFPGRWQNSLVRLARMADETEDYFEDELQKLDAQIAAARKKENEFQKTLDSLRVRKSIDQTRVPSDAIDLPLTPLLEAPDEIVRRYFRKIWQERGWALGAMGAEEWRRLAQAARTKTPTNQLPDDVFVSFPNGSTIRLERKRNE